MTPDAQRLYQAIEATWPPRKAIEAGPWILRDGAGGGKRVSAATQRQPFRAEDDLPAAEDAMRMLGQGPLFMIRDGDDALDDALAARGYQVIDPVSLYLCPVAHLADRPVPPVTAFTIWEPLAIMEDLWAQAGIGEARLRVMHRAKGPKTGILGRTKDSPAGVGFCALDRDVAMVHALEISAAYRGCGLGAWVMRAAAHWAAQHGAEWMSVLCVDTNTGANAFYTALGMRRVGRYHYRILPEKRPQHEP